jgi:hypothetical protein
VIDSNRSIAPIIVFAYKRLSHLQQTIASLRANLLAPQSALVIACDGPKHPEEVAACLAVQAYARTVEGFASVEVQCAEGNLGLAESVIRGVSDMLQAHDRVIVVEDDLVVSPHFLTFMNDGLERYSGAHRIASIHGYWYPVLSTVPETFFLRGADCWGWATWRRAWTRFTPDGASLRDQLLQRGLARAFNLDGAYPFFRMLEDQISGTNDSWAIRWHAACFLGDMLTLYPGRSLVHNTGNDGSGSHAVPTLAYDQNVSQTPIRIDSIELVESSVARAALIHYFEQQPSKWRTVSTAWVRRLAIRGKRLC